MSFISPEKIKMIYKIPKPQQKNKVEIGYEEVTRVDI